jgi:hypothetical protein
MKTTKSTEILAEALAAQVRIGEQQIAEAGCPERQTARWKGILRAADG